MKPLTQIPGSIAIAGLFALGSASAEPAEWRMKNGTTVKAELRAFWGEGDAEMVEFIMPGSKLLTIKRSELHSEDSKRLSPRKPGHEDFRFYRATIRPANDQIGQVTITYEFHRSLPGVKSCFENTLKVAPLKIGNDIVPPDAWTFTSSSGPDGTLVRFQATGPYDASKLDGSKFTATMELESGKDRKRSVQQIDFPKKPNQQLVGRFEGFEIKSLNVPSLGETPSRYVVLVSAEPKEKLIRYLTESNGRTAGTSGINASDAGTFATVKIDYWETFERKQISFEGTAGRPDIR